MFFFAMAHVIFATSLSLMAVTNKLNGKAIWVFLGQTPYNDSSRDNDDLPANFGASYFTHFEPFLSMAVYGANTLFSQA